MHYVNNFLAVLKDPMVMFGIAGQILFFSRFLVQWIVSEKEKKSVVPPVFWYLSIGGGGMLLVYALWRHDPVISIGQAVGLLVYLRNLVLIRKHKRQTA
jgi:lipid-A-disaccharide synthase-like uncharacterized protein